jgi:hypothetical protein
VHNSLSFGVDLLPVIEDSYHQFQRKCVFANVLRRGKLEGSLIDNSNDMFDLLDLDLIERTSLEDIDVVLESFLDDVQAILDVFLQGWRVELLHDSTSILNNCEEAIEDGDSALVVAAKVEEEKYVLDKFIDEEDLEVRLLLFFL